MRLFVAFALMSLVAASSMAATLLVPSGYATIQAGLDAATTGDTVLIDDGIYRGVGNRDLDLRGIGIVVRSVNGSSVTIIDCEGTPASPHRGFWFHSREDTLARIEGLTIRGGFGQVDAVTGQPTGGAIRCDSSSRPYFSDCLFLNNRASLGGALATFGSSFPRVVHCTFRHDSASYGGAIYSRGSYLSLSHCILDSNLADSGGAWGGHRTITIVTGCSFDGNLAQRHGGAVSFDSVMLWMDSCILSNNAAELLPDSLPQTNVFGGAMVLRRAGYYFETFGEPYRSFIRNTRFLHNSAWDSGALSLDSDSTLSLVKDQFIGNRADGFGGGVSCTGSIRIDSCYFADNSADNGSYGFGGGICISGSGPTVSHCLFENNFALYEGGGICCYEKANAHVTNCTFLNNRVAIFCGGAISCTRHDASAVDSCLFVGNSGGAAYVYNISVTNFSQCTFVSNTASAYWLAAHILYSNWSSGEVRNCLFAYGKGGVAIAGYEPTNVPVGVDTIGQFYNCDIFANEGGDWIGTLASQLDVNNNFTADPRFCDTSSITYSIRNNSPCAPTIHPSRQLVGLSAVGCSCCTSTTGDINQEDGIDLSDLSLLITYLVAQPHPTLTCAETADMDGTGSVDLSDLSRLIAYLTVHGVSLMPCPALP